MLFVMFKRMIGYVLGLGLFVAFLACLSGCAEDRGKGSAQSNPAPTPARAPQDGPLLKTQWEKEFVPGEFRAELGHKDGRVVILLTLRKGGRGELRTDGPGKDQSKTERISWEQTFDGVCVYWPRPGSEASATYFKEVGEELHEKSREAPRKFARVLQPGELIDP